jgi:predicted XRE-type DNA-binding protein
VKIRSVSANNRKRAFEVRTARGVMPFPYSRAEPMPSSYDPVTDVYVDPELGREGFTWRLASGAEGSLPVDAVLDYNADPEYLADLVAHELAVAAHDRIREAGLSRREICRRLGTSASQLYRLIDARNGRTSMRQLVTLLHVLGCDVTLRVTKRRRRR